MNFNYKYFLVFLFIFMILQYILLISELNYYLDMVSDIQYYKFNFYKNLENNFTLKMTSVAIIGYIALICIVYYYIIQNKKSIISGFIFTSILYLMWDVCLFFMFDKAVKYWPLLLYDTFVVGGGCMAISQYILYNYYPILKNYIGVLFVLYLLTMAWTLYDCYLYNPDLSNIKGIVLF